MMVLSRDGTEFRLTGYPAIVYIFDFGATDECQATDIYKMGPDTGYLDEYQMFD